MVPISQSCISNRGEGDRNYIHKTKQNLADVGGLAVIEWLPYF